MIDKEVLIALIGAGATILTAAATIAAAWIAKPRAPKSGVPRPRHRAAVRRRFWAALTAALVAGVVAVLAAAWLIDPTRRDGCVPIIVLPSNEKVGVLTELATRYNSSGRTYQGKCADIEVHKAKGNVTAALASGIWDEAKIGAPKPHVWIPASSTRVKLLRQSLAGADQDSVVPEGDLHSIAQTPLVIAMPRPMAQALGWPATPIGWSDVSGSMTNVVNGGATKLALAKQSATTALAAFADDDEVGLWTFASVPASSGRDDPYTERVPPASMSVNRARLAESIGSLEAEGGTPLYTTVRQAHLRMATSATADRINAVVLLSDGHNDYPPDDNLDALIEYLRTASESGSSVRVFTIAYGAESPPQQLESIALASRGRAYDARDPATIDAVFVNVISNF